MNKKTGKPTAEAKALSLYLMAHKAKSPTHKEKSKRINRLWSLVTKNELSTSEYAEEVDKMLASYGGYLKVVEETVKFYIDKTGEWTLKGEDKYCTNAQEIADRILKK